MQLVFHHKEKSDYLQTTAFLSREIRFNSCNFQLSYTVIISFSFSASSSSTFFTYLSWSFCASASASF